MKKIFILAFFFSFVNCQLDNDTISLNYIGCGKRIRDLKPLPYKIVGGKNAIPEDWAWQVAMNYNNRFTCGGSLINSQWVLTAAHCVYGRNISSSYSFNLGLHDLDAPEKWSTKINVSRIIIHPNFNEILLYNDIALMKLETQINYSNQILPICIPNSKMELNDKDSWATGWGTLKAGGTISRYLMEVEMPILSDSKCKEKFEIVNTTLSICSGETGQNKDTCQGDSGGPLVVYANKRWELAGITSWGYGCGDGGVYTRTSYYYDWIIDQIKNF